MTDTRTLTPTELADLFGVSVGTLANWRVQNRGPLYRKQRLHRNARVIYPRREAINWGKRNGYIAKGASAT